MASPVHSPSQRALAASGSRHRKSIVAFGGFEESDGSSSSSSDEAQRGNPLEAAHIQKRQQKAIARNRRRSTVAHFHPGGDLVDGEGDQEESEDLDEHDIANDWGAESVDGGASLDRYLTYHATGGAVMGPSGSNPAMNRATSFARAVGRNESGGGTGGLSTKAQSMWVGSSDETGVTVAEALDRNRRRRASSISSDHNATSQGKNVRRGSNGAIESLFCCSCRKPTSYVPHALRHRSLVFGVYGTNPLRLLVHSLVTSRGFEALVLLVILANCVFLAMDDPRQDDSEKPEWNTHLELGFACFYTLEMLLKIFAFGFVRHRGSYLKDAWNRLDAAIVLVTWLAFVPGVGNYSGLRVLRVLRPLRSMNAIKGLKTLVIALLRSFESLWPVLVLGAIVFSIFAVVATQLWAGKLTTVCVPQLTNESLSGQPFVADNSVWYYATVRRSTSSLFTERCRVDADEYDEWLGRNCPPGYVCTEGQGNPGLGFISYDHAGWALLTIFQVATFESWPAILRATTEVNGPAVFFFFFFVLLIGAYFVPNLALAVINERYHTAIRKQREYDAQVAAMVIKNKEREEREKNIESNVTSKLQRATSNGSITKQRSGVTFVAVGSAGAFDNTNGGSTFTAEDHEDDVEEDSHTGPSSWLAFRNALHRFTQGFPLPDYTVSIALAENKASLSLNELDRAEEDDAGIDDDNNNFVEDEGDDYAAAARKRREHHQRVNHRRHMTVFAAFIILCIFLNTVVLAAQHHNQPAWMDLWTERANLAFLVIFGFELLIVLAAVGFRRFFTSGFFVLDLLVVIASIVELFAAGSAVLTVFRALRLLRPLKLVRNAPSLRAVVAVMIDAVRETIYVNLVLFLLMLIFALGGMQFFGGEMGKAETDLVNGTASQPPVEVRAKFDNFLAAFLAVFQVVTTDNWTDIMWQAMYATHPAAALYFVVLVLVGFYVVVNLFLSILITGFEREAERTHRDKDGDDSDAGSSGDDDEEAERREKVNDVHSKMQSKLALGGTLNEAAKNGTVGSTVSGGHEEEVTVLFRSEREQKDQEADHRRRQMAPVLKSLFKSFGQVPETALSLALQAQKESIEMQIQAMPLTRFRCWRCDTMKQKVLSAPPFVQKANVHDIHDRQCAITRARHGREEFLLNLIAIVHEQMAENSMLTREMSEALMVNAHKAKCFMRLELTDLRSWRDIRDEAREELDVLRLAVGEEQLGRAHVSYVYQGLRLRQMTNGSTSLFLFGPENGLRAWLTAVTQHRAFDAFIFVLIALSTILLIIDNPRTQFDDDTKSYIEYADLAFTSIFALEIVMRVVALGLVLHPGSYLRSGWHWLDVISVGVSFATTFGAIKALRTLRFLRPLRTIKRYRGLRLVVSTIVTSIKGITHVVLLSMISYLIFGILAVQLLAGKLYQCNDDSITTIDQCTGVFNATANVFDNARNTYTPTTFTIERRWEKMTRNFDHIGSSILTLFQVSTGDDWADVMYNAIDARSTTEAPERDHRPLMGLFFVVFYIVSSFFFVNLFVGVVIVNFSKVKQKADGVAFLTPEQREWVDSQRAILQMRPEPLLLPANAGALRRALDRLVRSTRFELFIAFCITLNVVVIAMEYEGMDGTYALSLQYASWAFAGLFFGEMCLKLGAHGVRYFYLGWNRFDAFLAVLGIIAIGFELVEEVDNYVPTNVAVLRALRFIRVLRVLRLFKKARRVRVLVETLWHSLPSIANISLLLFILYVVFGVIGVQLFANVRSGGRFLDDDLYNFHDFGRALQLLFIFTTNEKWSDAMYDLMEDPPYCNPDNLPASDCGILYAPGFFVPFVVIASLVVTNLFLAIILDNFATTMNLDQSRVTLSDLHRFTDVWASFDPDGSNMMPTRLLPKLLAALQPPLGTTRANSRLELLLLMSQYRILDHDGQVHFAEVIVPLARQAISQGGTSLRGLDVAAWGFDELDDLPTTWYEHKPAHTGHSMAATYIAACFRRHRERDRFLATRPARAKPSFMDGSGVGIGGDGPQSPKMRKQRRSIALVMEDTDF